MNIYIVHHVNKSQRYEEFILVKAMDLLDARDFACKHYSCEPQDIRAYNIEWQGHHSRVAFVVNRPA